MDDPTKNGDQSKKDGGGKEDLISKAEYEKVLADLEKTKADLEEMKAEVLSDEYLEFLEKGKPSDKSDDDDDDDRDKVSEIEDEHLEKLSKKEILELAVKKAKEELKADLDNVKMTVEEKEQEERRLEVERFRRTHSDFEQYRPIMYGLSTDPKNANLSLQELYEKAKEHVKGIHAEVSESEKEKQRKLAAEKPGGSSESFEELKKLSAEEATVKAVEEVESKLGPLPPA